MSDPANNTLAFDARTNATPTTFADDARSRMRLWRRILIRIGSCVGVVALALVGIYCYQWYAAEKALQDAIAEADRLDPGWRLADLEATRVAVPAELNSAPHVRKAGRDAMTVMHTGTNGKDLINGRTEDLYVVLDPRTRLTLDETIGLRAALAPFAGPLAKGRKIADFPNGRYPFDTAPSIRQGLPHVDDSRAAGYLLIVDAMLQIQDGDSAQAWACCRAIQNLGRSFGDEPMELAPLMRRVLVKDAIRLMERILAQGHVGADELAESQKRLQEELAYPALLITIRSNRAHLHFQLTQVETGEVALTELKDWLDVNRNVPGAADKLRDFLSGNEVKPAHAWMLHFITKAVELAKLPDHEAYPALQKHLATIADAPELARRMPLFSRYRRLTSLPRYRTLIGCACVGLAAERYRLKHDRWPSELADLVAERLLDAVPADSYDGKPLRYRKTPDGVVVYSAGPSGDGKGDALDGNPPNANDDRLEFRLWNSEKR